MIVPSPPWSRRLPAARDKTRRATVGLLLSSIAAGGCEMTPAKVHERFAELCPAEVAVLPVENRTLHDLRRVATAGPLQRLTLGAAEVDVPAALGRGMVEALERRGYRPEVRPEGALESRGEVQLRGEITGWRRSAGSGGSGVGIAGRVALVKSATRDGPAVTLFERTFAHRKDFSGPHSAADVEEEVERAGAVALSGLPPPGTPARGAAAPPLPAAATRP